MGPLRPSQPFSLAAAAAGFRSHAECVAELSASLPPELTAETDPANLAERVCQTRRALAEKSLSLCEEIQDAHWPDACRRLLAGLYGRPEACPTLTPRSRGREPACLALASRDVQLCRAVGPPAERKRCQALLGPAGGCQALRTSADVSACERDRRRWRAVLQTAPGPQDPAAAPDPRAPLNPRAPPDPRVPSDPGAPLQPGGEPELFLEVTAGGQTLQVRHPGVSRGIVVPWEANGRARVSIGALCSPDGRPLRARQIRIALEVPRLETASSLTLGAEGPGAPGPSDPPRRAGAPGEAPDQTGPGKPARRPPPGLREAGAAPRERAPGLASGGPTAPGALALGPPRSAVPAEPKSARSSAKPEGMSRGAPGDPLAPRAAATPVARGRARLCVLWKGEAVPLSAVTGTVELGPVPARRGAEVSGAIEASFTVGGETVRVKGRLRTFVRDVVPSAWLTGSCAETLAEKASTSEVPGDGSPRPGAESRPPCYFVAHWDGLTQVGYRAYGLRPGEACARVGLVENDVVTAAGRRPLRIWADVTALYGLLGSKGPLELTIRRGGRALTLKRQ